MSHAILHQFFSSLSQAQASQFATDPVSLVSVLDNHVTRVTPENISDYARAHSIARWQSPDFTTQLLREFEPFNGIPITSEYRFNTQFLSPNTRVSGSIDLILQLQNCPDDTPTTLVIDFKTGRSLPAKAAVKRGEYTQLPLYSYVAQQAGYAIAAALYWPISEDAPVPAIVLQSDQAMMPPSRQRPITLNHDYWASAIDIWRSTIAGIQADDYTVPNSVTSLTCQLCPYQSICSLARLK